MTEKQIIWTVEPPVYASEAIHAAWVNDTHEIDEARHDTPQEKPEEPKVCDKCARPGPYTATEANGAEWPSFVGVDLADGPDTTVIQVGGMSDVINHPDHYTTHPSGVECIQITEHMGFLDGNAMKYLWRHKDKGKPVEDLKKARWYIDRLIAKYERERAA